MPQLTIPSWKMWKRLNATKQRELRLQVLLTTARPFFKGQKSSAREEKILVSSALFFSLLLFLLLLLLLVAQSLPLLPWVNAYSALFHQEPATKQKSFAFGRLGNLPAPNVHLFHDWNGRHPWHSTVYILSCNCTLHTAFCLLLDAGGGHCHLPGTAQGALCGFEGRQVDSCLRLLLGLV